MYRCRTILHLTIVRGQPILRLVTINDPSLSENNTLLAKLHHHHSGHHLFGPAMRKIIKFYHSHPLHRILCNSLDRSLPHGGSACKCRQTSVRMFPIRYTILLSIQKMCLRSGGLMTFNRHRIRPGSSGFLQCRHVQEAIEKRLFLHTFSEVSAKYCDVSFSAFFNLMNLFGFGSFRQKKFHSMKFHSITLLGIQSNRNIFLQRLYSGTATGEHKLQLCTLVLGF